MNKGFAKGFSLPTSASAGALFARSPSATSRPGGSQPQHVFQNRSFPNEKFFWFWWPVGLLKCAIKQWLSFALCCLAVPLHIGSSSIARAKLKLLKIRGISPRRLTTAPWHRQEKVKRWIPYLVLKVLMQCLRSACTTRAIRKADVISRAPAGAPFLYADLS